VTRILRFFRRLGLVLAMLALPAGLANAAPDLLKVQPDDVAIGSEKAPVTIIEYASMTCGHCAAFHNNVMPELKKRFIDTGKVRFVYREFPLDQFALRASMIARCSGDKDRFEGLTTLFFRTQPRWVVASDPLAEMAKVVRVAGIGEEEFKRCTEDKALADKILERRMAGSQKFDIAATPTFIINGKVVSGETDIETFAKLIAEAGGK